MAAARRHLAVVVKCHDFSCSGIVLDADKGIILTVGAVLNMTKESNCEQEDKVILYIAGNQKEQQGQGQQELRTGEKVEVIVKSPTHLGLEEFTTLEGDVVVVWKDCELSNLLQKVFPNHEWTFSDGQVCEGEPEGKSKRGSHNRFHMSTFTLLHAKNLPTYLNHKQYTCSVTQNHEVHVGDTVTVAGTPFGSECLSVFFNSLSKGIVSNVIGSDCKMLLTDARTVPGCEGCPVFITSSVDRHESLLYGIVLTTICWRQGDITGFTLVYSISHLLKQLHNLLSTLQRNQPLCALVSSVFHQHRCEMNNQSSGAAALSSKEDTMNIPSSTLTLPQQIQENIVLVQYRNTWGSGIIVDMDKGLIITCSHVLSEWNNMKSSVYVLHSHSNPVRFTAEVLYVADHDCALDFALLRIPVSYSLKAIKFQSQPQVMIQPELCDEYTLGETVLAVGYSMFGRDMINQGPTVTSGVLSSVTTVDGEAVMLQSTAAVHSGGSGGALVSMETGKLIGMITSNTKDAKSSATFPHINFSIPVNLIVKLMVHALSGSKELDAKLLHLTNNGITRVWQLQEHKPNAPPSKL